MRIVLSASVLLAMFIGHAGAGDASVCGEEAIPGGVVTRMIDSRSFALRDGREILLAGIDVPGSAPTGLAETLPGRPVTLRRAESGPDRYQRTAAFVTLGEGGELVQQTLVAAGKARLGARIGTAACTAALLAAEREARQSRLGLWADPVYSVRRASDGRDLLTEVGRFVVVQGRVVSVRESGGTLYVNFGRRWSEALTVTILKRNQRAFAEAGFTHATLEKSRLTVRGFIEERNGPRIEASRPEQIEIARN